VKVVVRCRPMNSVEKDRNESNIVQMDTKLGSIRVMKPDCHGGSESEFKTFTFDSVYPPGSTQQLIFDECTRPIIDSVLNGYNGTLFCYGQTGTGKTFTMEGVVDDESLRGMVPRAFYYVFAGITQEQGKNMEFLVRGSFLEIYKDDVFDLLNSKMRSKMEVKESPDKGVFVKDLSTFTVKSPDDLLKILKVGQKQRKVGATKMNEGSSRSHSILTITIESSEKEVDTKTGAESVHYKVGKLNMVDLAGSERQKKTEAVGDRLDEAKSINWSLTVLGNCIKALVEPGSKHVPYRDSKLTRLLQDSLGGNTKTVMCANLGPAATNFDETISTLRYADRAKSIKNKPVVNEDPKDTMLREMQDEISRLRAMLEARKSGMGGPLMSPTSMGMQGHGQPSSTEGERMMGMDAIQGDNVIEEIVEKEVIQDTGIKPEDLVEIQRQTAEEHQRLIDQFMAENRNEEEARIMAEQATKKYEQELRRKAEILAKEEAQLSKLQAVLNEKEQQLHQGGAALDAAKRSKEMLKQAEFELEQRRQEQQQLIESMQEAEERRCQLLDQYANTSDALRDTTSKLKQLWKIYQEKKSSLAETVDEFEVERQDLLDTIRSLDRTIKLKNLVLEEFIPTNYLDAIESQATYDPIADCWTIRGVEYAGNNIQRSEMMFGGGGGGMGMDGASGGFGAGGTGHSPPRRMFKRASYGGSGSVGSSSMSPGGGGGGGGMQVNGYPATATPNRARFFSYAPLQKGGGMDDGGSGEAPTKEKKKKHKKKDR